MLRFLQYWTFGNLVLLAGVIAYWLQDRSVPVHRTQAVEVVGSTHQGGGLFLHWKVIRDRSCAATKQEVVVVAQGTRWVLPLTTSISAPGPVGVEDEFVTRTALPLDIPPGQARLRTVLAYTCNPTQYFWPIIDQVPEVPFVILPKS